MDLPLPLIAHLSGQNRRFITITNISNENVTFLKNGFFTRTESKNTGEFLKEWSGVALLSEKTEKAGEDNYAANRWKERIDSIRVPFLLTSVLLIILFP